MKENKVAGDAGQVTDELSGRAAEHKPRKHKSRAAWRRVAGGACLLGLVPAMGQMTARGQSVTNAAPVTEQFYQQAFGYLTSFNTNLTTFTSTNFHGSIWAGADYQSGVNVASSLAAEVPVYKALSLDAVVRNADVAGTLLSAQSDVGVNWSVFDTQITAGIGLGDNFSAVGGVPSGLYASVFGEVKKAMTQNTFAGVRLESDIPFRSAKGGGGITPVLCVFVGFRF